MKHKVRRLTISVLIAAFVGCAPPIARADNLLRFFPLLQGNFLYTDNVYLTPNNAQGDFDSNFAAGFYLDVSTPKRYATLEYSTFGSLFVSHSNLDRAGQAQFFRVTDQEQISPQTKVNLYEWFVRDSPTLMALTSGDRLPEFTPGFTEFLLANDHVIINTFNAVAAHSYSPRWSSVFGLEQETLAPRNSGTGTMQTAHANLLYHVNEAFAIGPGYRFIDRVYSSTAQPNSEVQWPVAYATWLPRKDLYLDGFVGPMVAYNTTGVSRTRVDPGGVISIRYSNRRFHATVSGGQEPGLTAGLGTGGIQRFGNGEISYGLTRRVTASANAGYMDAMPAGADARLIGYGAGLSTRSTRWLTLFVRYVGLRRTYSGNFNPAVLPSHLVIGREAVANYYVVGASVAFEAFRWSWQ
ncbi:MAG: hypothetical protein ACREQI_01810 [Candidatus Binataceae bacterium]